MDDKTREMVEHALTKIRPAGDAAVILERLLWDASLPREEPTLPNPNVEVGSGMSAKAAAEAIGAQLRGWMNADDALPNMVRVMACMRACREANAEVRAADDALTVAADARSAASRALQDAQRRAAERWQELHDLARGT